MNEELGMRGGEIQTNVLRTAVLAATRIVERGSPTVTPVEVSAAVLKAHLSLFDVDMDQSTPERNGRFHEAVDLAADLVNFGRAVQGGRNA